MDFRVEISPEALGDLDGISTFIGQRARTEVAERWFNGIFAAIRRLSSMPHRCPIAEESLNSMWKSVSFCMESETAGKRD